MKIHSTQSYPVENTRTEGECTFYTNACKRLKELIQGNGKQEDIRPEDLLKLKVTMCCKPKVSGDKEEWAIKDITLPPKLQQCNGKCSKTSNNGYESNNIDFVLYNITLFKI